MRYALLAVLVTATACGVGSGPSAGGPYLVYTRGLGSTRPAVWIANADGSSARLLVRGADYGVVSPDGRWVAYGRCLAPPSACRSGNAPDALFLVAVSGGRPRLLRRAASIEEWSPGSDRILARRDDAIFTLDLDGTAYMLEGHRAGTASFSPDGDWIVYSKARARRTCAADLFIVRATGEAKRRLTTGRDILPVWGREWIAFSRDTKTCAYKRRLWRIRADGTGLEPITGVPPGGGTYGAYYGFDAVAWSPDERTLLAGLISEWGDEAIRLDVATGSFTRLGGYAVGLSRNGRVALVDSGGAEGPYTISSVNLADGRRRVLVHGDVSEASWNR